jgi:hypothetical protein
LTLFLTFASLESIKTREEAVAFFKENFPSALDIVGDQLIDDFEKNPRGNLVTINVGQSRQSCSILAHATGHTFSLVFTRYLAGRCFAQYGPVSCHL